MNWLITLTGRDFAPALGDNDNYVTDAEKIVLANTSGVNTGDQQTADIIEPTKAVSMGQLVNYINVLHRELVGAGIIKNS